MKFVIQRVKEASVSVDNEIVGRIGKGLLVLMGVTHGDTRELTEKMVKKLVKLRIFDDENGKTNLDLSTVEGELLLISQFTLYADARHGNRPSFTDAADPDTAKELYEYAVEKCGESVAVVEKGVFGAHMEVSLINDGPFTMVLDSEDLK